MCTLRNGSRKRFTAYCDTESQYFHQGGDASVAQRWRLSAPGECRVPRVVTRMRGCVVEARQESSAVKSSGRRLLVDLACGETQEEHLRNQEER